MADGSRDWTVVFVAGGGWVFSSFLSAGVAIRSARDLSLWIIKVKVEIGMIWHLSSWQRGEGKLKNDQRLNIRQYLGEWYIYYPQIFIESIFYILLPAEICMVIHLHLNYTLSYIRVQDFWTDGSVDLQQRQENHSKSFSIEISCWVLWHSFSTLPVSTICGFSEMQMQGQPPHYANGISNTSETKWRWRFKVQRSDTDVGLGRKAFAAKQSA